jgi:HlyD family secretion protein
LGALLALASGGYGVEVVDRSGTHHLVGVSTGVFAGGEVQVSGAGIQAGTRIVVAQ